MSINYVQIVLKIHVSINSLMKQYDEKINKNQTKLSTPVPLLIEVECFEVVVDLSSIKAEIYSGIFFL